jgi:predicted patatin/cPLA2 family phospholipase
MSNNALVLEGGGFRSMFTAGAVDVLMENGIYDFSSVWGVSAGAIAASSFKSRQIGRTMRIMLAFRDDRRFMSLWSLATTGDIAGADFMYKEVQDALDPCDTETFNANPMQMYAVASDVTFGTPAYLHVRSFPDDVEMVRASASMPLVSRVVELDGRALLDGGTTDSIPVAVAMGLEGAARVEGYVPAEKAVVVLTQDAAYEKDGANERMVLRSHRYDGYPYYLDALETRPARYNACRKMVHEMADRGEIVCLEPPAPVEVATSGSSGEKCLTLYLQGRAEAEAHLDEIRAYLAG